MHARIARLSTDRGAFFPYAKSRSSPDLSPALAGERLVEAINRVAVTTHMKVKRLDEGLGIVPDRPEGLRELDDWTRLHAPLGARLDVDGLSARNRRGGLFGRPRSAPRGAARCAQSSDRDDLRRLHLSRSADLSARHRLWRATPAVTQASGSDRPKRDAVQQEPWFRMYGAICSMARFAYNAGSRPSRTWPRDRVSGPERLIDNTPIYQSLFS